MPIFVARRVARQRFLSLKRASQRTREDRQRRNEREKLKRRRQLLSKELRRAAQGLAAEQSAKAFEVSLIFSGCCCSFPYLHSVQMCRHWLHVPAVGDRDEGTFELQVPVWYTREALLLFQTLFSSLARNGGHQ